MMIATDILYIDQIDLICMKAIDEDKEMQEFLENEPE